MSNMDPNPFGEPDEPGLNPFGDPDEGKLSVFFSLLKNKSK